MSIEKTIRNSAYKLMHFSWFRLLTSPFIAFGSMLKKERTRYKLESRRVLNEVIFNDFLDSELTVINGPFQGLKYPEFVSFTSTIVPKLLGIYESEIYNDLNAFTKAGNYNSIYNIGAADGYYAVGLAKMFPETPVFGYDINPNALDFVARMASINDVNNLSLKGLFTKQDLMEIKGRNLIICDIDGFELELFQQHRNLNELEASDIIIETHDYVDSNITSGLVQLLGQTHEVNVIPYKPIKTDELPVNLFNNAPDKVRKVACLERIVDNKWLIAKSRKAK